MSSWQWITVLGIIAFMWTVYKITETWQQVTYYRYATDETKNAIWSISQGIPVIREEQ